MTVHRIYLLLVYIFDAFSRKKTVKLKYSYVIKSREKLMFCVDLDL